MAMIATATTAWAQNPAAWKALTGQINLFMANDLGRNGYDDQKPIAELMGTMAEIIGPKCVVAAGDIHHFNGVASVNDPLWMTNFELIYAHPALMIDWFPVCGNHEYRGNTQAVLDYAKISRRWRMPAKYYTKVFESHGTTLRIVFIDTTPLIDDYRNNPAAYPDAAKEDVQKQLSWLDQTLRDAKEDWVIVVGHHPLYAQTQPSDVERAGMRKRVLPILHKYGNVAIYACGHIHDFQHIKMKNDPIDYVGNSSASLSHEVKPTEGTVFCSSEPGFSVIAVSKDKLNLYMIDKKGNVLHTVSKTK